MPPRRVDIERAARAGRAGHVPLGLVHELDPADLDPLPTDVGLVYVSTSTGKARMRKAGSVDVALEGQSPLTTKGDLFTHNGVNDVRMPVGADGTVPTASAASPNGWVWQAPAGSAVSIGCDPVTSILATSANGHYERERFHPSIVQLKSPNNFPTARALTAATPEFGWTTLNMAKLTTKDENTTTPNGTYGDHDGTSTDWDVAPPTCPARWQTMQYMGYLEVVGLCYNNGNAGWESTGIVVARDSAKNTFVKAWMGHNGGSVRVSCNNNAGNAPVSSGGAAITAGQQAAGVWIKIILVGLSASVWFHRTASAEPPESGWEILTTYTVSSTMYDTLDVGHLWLTVNVANHLTGGHLWFGWRADPDHGWQGLLPLFQATRRATTGDTLKLIASGYAGGGAWLPDQAKLRLLCADAENRLPRHAGAVLWGCTSSAAPNPAAPSGALETAAALQLKLAGTMTVTTTPAAYWALFASISSTNGEQEGSIDTALLRLAT